MNNSTSWWDDFSNDLATDLAPLIALFGESPTKQFLSECLSFTDIVIFATAPIGIITALISAIRVRGSSSLRAFIGRAQEGGGNAEAELCSSTSRDVCELYNNGGIARVFGRPKLLEVVLDDQSHGHDFYSSDRAPPSAGIYSFKEYISKLTKQQTPQTGKDDKDTKDWEEQRTYHLQQILCLERQSTTDKEATPNMEFAPNPNLSLNIGIKKKPMWWFIIAAVVGVLLQSFVLIWASVARYKLGFVRDGPPAKYAVPMTVIGTVSVVLGVGLCAFLVDSSTEERVFKRGKPQSHMYWVQPGNQYLGDQAFDSFAYSDRNQPLDTYTSSRKKQPDSSAKQKGQPEHVKRGDMEQGWLVWTTITLTTLGFIVQFVGLRACHSSVAIAQLGATLIMSIIRSGLRTQRMKKGDNCMSDRPDAYVGHELDWLAMYMDLRDEPDGGNKTKKNKRSSGGDDENRNVLRWEIPSSAAVVAFPPHTKPPGIPSPKDAILLEDSKLEAPTDMAKGFKLEAEAESESLKWLQKVYSPSSYDEDLPFPYESARRFLYRSRLARMTTDWDDNQIAVRNLARNLAKAITETANALTLRSTWNKDYEDVEVLLWPIRSRLLKTSYDLASTPDVTMALPVETGASEIKATQDPRHDPGHLIYLALKRSSMGGKFGAWTIDESELEAVVGLWAWTINERIHHISQISDAHSNHPAIFRILSTESGADGLKFWQTAGGTSITEMTLPQNPPGLLICGLHNSGTIVSLDRPVQAFKVKHTIPRVCAQELYSLFFLSMLKAVVKDIGGETIVREDFATFLLTNTTILDVRRAFIESNLGSSDDAFACTIPVLISSDKLPPVISTLAGARKTAEQYIKKQEWKEAERLLHWALAQCKKVNDFDSIFDFENHQRLLILAMCECYRKSLLAQPPSTFGVRGFLHLMGDQLSPTQKEIKLLAYNCSSNSTNSSSKSNPLRNLDTLAIAIRYYGYAALRLTAKMTNLVQDVSQLRQRLQNEETVLTTDDLGEQQTKSGRPLSLSETSIDVETAMPLNEALNEMITQKNLTETLYLVSRIEIERRRIKLDDSLSMAAERGWYTVVRALIELGANLDYKDGKGRTAITYAAIGGELNVFEHLLGKGIYPNSMDDQFRSPLSYASDGGHIRIVKRLLDDERVSADPKDKSDHTPLWNAVIGGHEQIVKLLLDKNVDVNVKDGYHETALQRASAEGYEQIVKLLLDKNANVNAEGGYYGTALQRASAEGYEQIVKLLLDKNANVNAEGGYYGTALQGASAGGYEQIVKLLLDKNANVNAKGRFIENALQEASAKGHEGIVKLLLDKNVDVNAEGGSNETALQTASAEGYEGIVKLLLDKNVDVNAKGDFGTALQRASAGGYEQIVKLLLDKNANVNAEGGHYGTALQRASAEGYEQIVKLLLDKNANVNAKGGFSGTALQRASAGGYEQIVKLLLDKNANVNAEGRSSGTALQRASTGGYEQIVKLLLDKNANVNAEGRSSGTALQRASTGGYEQIVKLLLNKDANVNAEGGSNGTALERASTGGYEQIVKLLLDKNANVNAKGRSNGTALQGASAGGYEQIVKLLLDKNANVNAESDFGTALQGASAGGYEGIVKLLLDKNADVNAEGGSNRSALQEASAGGHEGIVKLLLNKNANVNAKGRSNGTALQEASAGGYEQIVKLLLDKNADVNAEGGFSGTALQRASAEGHEGIVKLLLNKNVDVNAKGDFGTALQRASARDYGKIVKLLRDNGAI